MGEHNHTKNTLNNHEKRIKGLETHPCRQEQRIQEIEKKQEKQTTKQKKNHEKIQNAFQQILHELEKLRTDIKLNQQTNNYQNKTIDEIKENKMEEIRNKWVKIGIIIGTLMGLLGPLILMIIEHKLYP